MSVANSSEAFQRRGSLSPYLSPSSRRLGASWGRGGKTGTSLAPRSPATRKTVRFLRTKVEAELRKFLHRPRSLALARASARALPPTFDLGVSVSAAIKYGSTFRHASFSALTAAAAAADADVKPFEGGAEWEGAGASGVVKKIAIKRESGKTTARQRDNFKQIASPLAH